MEKKYETYAEKAKYSENGFWSTLKKAGGEVVEKALVLYYVMKDPETPKSSKVIITAALAYFILPFDIIPDFIPLAGFTDDLAALATVMLKTSSEIKDVHREKARQKCKELGF